MLVFPTYQTLITKPVAAAGGGDSDSSGFIETNLFSHWDAGNSNSYSGSGSTLTDLSGNSNDGTLKNTSNISYSSSNNGHLVFSTTATTDKPWIWRTTDYIKDVEEDDYTIELWVNLYYPGGNKLLWRNTPPTAGFPENKAIYVYNGKMRVSDWFTGTGTNTKGSWTYLDSSAQYTSGEYAGWEHLVFSRIGTGNDNTKFYRNNSLIQTWTNKVDWDRTNSATDTRRSSFGNGMRGKFAIYRFYLGTGLTSSQVTTNYNVDKSRFGL